MNDQQHPTEAADGQSLLTGVLATTPVVLGRSYDDRTQHWRVTCPKCSKEFEPRTTRMAKQEMDCPKCGAMLFADYNAEPPTLIVANAEITGRALAQNEADGA